MAPTRSRTPSSGRVSPIARSGPASQISTHSAITPIAVKMFRSVRRALIGGVLASNRAGAFGDGARDQDLHAPVLRAPLRNLVRSERHVGPLSLDLDPARIREALLEEGRDRFRPLDRKVEVRGEAYGADGCGVGMADHLDAPLLLFENPHEALKDGLEILPHRSVAGGEQDEVRDPNDDRVRGLLDGQRLRRDLLGERRLDALNLGRLRGWRGRRRRRRKNATLDREVGRRMDRSDRGRGRFRVAAEQHTQDEVEPQQEHADERPYRPNWHLESGGFRRERLALPARRELGGWFAHPAQRFVEVTLDLLQRRGATRGGAVDALE